MSGLLRPVRVVLLAELLVAIAVGLGLWSLRRQTFEAERRHLATTAGAMAAQVEATLDAADAALHATRDELARGLVVPGTDAADALLRARIGGLPRFRALVIVDAAGLRVANSLGARGDPLSVAQREFFAAARDARPGSLHVSPPYLSAVDGRAAIAVATDWRDDAGGFRGVIVLLGDPEFLDRDFPQMAPAPDTQLAIYRRDRVLIADGPGEGSAQGMTAMLAAGTGTDADPDPRTTRTQVLRMPGDEARLVATRALPRYGLTVAVSRGQGDALAAWTEQAWLVGAFAASALVVTLLLSLRNAREQALRRASEAALVAEQARTSERLARARRLEALGTLAGGVAHDFNNVLASVLGFAELARDASADIAQARRLEQVLQAGQRGKALVERILAFSRGAPRVRTPFRLQPVVDEVLQLLGASPATGVRVERALAAPDAVVRGDATAVFEAAMNLCTNGLQAMPRGGRLSVALDPLVVTEGVDLFEGRLEPGRYARLRVQDEGEGIAPDALPHLFEPFFTTKAGGPGAAHRGTGLGLAVVHGVVSDLGGAIDVHSVPGHGACFELYLPCVDDSVVADAGPRAGGDGVPMGTGEAVLVVDDEPALVALAEEMLAGLGYEPFGVTSSVEALARFEAEPDRFEALLTDEVMPGLTGTALASAVHVLRPALPVVLASGWGGAQFEQRAAAAGVSVVVGKPLARIDLARALARAMLEARRSR